MKYKGLMAGVVLTGAVATPIGLTIAASANAYTNDDYKVMIASAASVSSLNMFKTSTIDESNVVVGLYNAALIKSRPSGDDNGGLETSLSIAKLDDGLVANTGAFGTLASTADFASIPEGNTGSYVYESFTPDLSLGLTYFGQYSRAGYNIRKTRFWNGDRVTAEDFLETIKIALNVKNAVPWMWQLTNTLAIVNAKNIVNAQNNDGMTFEQALKKYPLGVQVDPKSVIPESDMSTSSDGKTYYANEYANGKERHSKLIYSFDGPVAQNFATLFSGGAIGTPTSIRHFEKIGFDNWGTSIDNIMGCGPYKLKYFDLDYKLIADRWSGYWDRSRTISPQIEMRVLPDTSSQIQLFREGKIGKVTFGTAMLPQFLGDANLKKYVKPTNWAENLEYIAFNTKIENPNAKFILDSDFRNAVQYSMDRQQFLAALGADNSFSTETFSTLQQMQDGSGNGVVNNAMTFNNKAGFLDSNVYPVGGSAAQEWNKIYDLGGSEGTTDHADMFTRSEDVLSSTDISKNGKVDRVHNSELAKQYFASFKKAHPDFKEINLKLQIDSSLREQVTIIKQGIEENLPGVTVTIVPKPSNVEKQVAADMDWDMRFDTYDQAYPDSWTFYHLMADKVIVDPSISDALARAKLEASAHSDGFGLVDYVAQRLHQDPNYFAEHYFDNGSPTKDEAKVYNGIIAQFLRMENAVGSTNPNIKTKQIDDPSDPTGKTKMDVPKAYDEDMWTRVPAKENNFEGYGGQFAKFKSVFPDATSWGTEMKDFVAKNSSSDEWNNKDYRYSVIYPFIEKLIRESSIGVGITRIQNSYIASRFIGEVNYGGILRYYGWVYQADNIPPSRFALPGIEAITK